MPLYELTEPEGEFNEDGERKEFEVVPEDTTLEAKVLVVEERTKPFKDKEGNDIVKCEFTFESNYRDVERRFWGETGIKYVDHPDCKLRAWSQELLGTELPPGFRLNTDNLVGLPCRITMGVRIPKSGKNEGKEVNYVKDVMRPKGSSLSYSSTGSAEPDPF